MPTELERYLFDVNGYLVLPGVLSADKVAELNAVIDSHGVVVGATQDRRPERGLVLQWGKPFMDLLDHPRVLPYLTEWLGSSLRIDHVYPIFAGQGAPGQGLHGGAVPHEPTASYTVKGGRIRSGLTVAAYALTDAPAGPHGGFACVPGSHKAEFALPQELRTESEHVTQVPVRAGDVLIFTEALTHAAYAWMHDFERRVLFYKYSPGPLAWAHAEWPQDVLDAATERQQLLLQPPYNFASNVGLRKLVDAPGKDYLAEYMDEAQQPRQR